MSLLQMSIQGGLMIAVTAILRAVARDYLPKKAFLLLWGLVLLRLLVPVQISSSLSVFSLAQHVPSVRQLAHPDLSGDVLLAESGNAPASAVLTAPDATPVGAFPAAASQHPFSCSVTLLWLAGAAASCAYFLVGYRRCSWVFRTSLPVSSGLAQSFLQNHRLRRHVTIRQSSCIRTPMTSGVRKPVILMPGDTDWSDEETLRYVLFHEMVHIRRLDAVSKLTAVLTVCLHWFNPLAWVMLVLFNRDLELACDETVIAQFGLDRRASYAMALIHMEEQKSAAMPFCACFSRNALEERIKAMMKMKKTSIAAMGAAALMIFAQAACLGTSARAEQTPDAFALTPAWTGLQFTPTEWWTAEEFAEWLEEEKISLQSIIGEKCWTPSRGDFVWTQDLVDETIRLYEGMLNDLKKGTMISKSVDAEENVIMFSYASSRSSVSEPVVAVDEDSAVPAVVITKSLPDDADGFSFHVGDATVLTTSEYSFGISFDSTVKTEDKR